MSDPCGNQDLGLNCVCKWVADHPGTIQYSCEWCGLYAASRPQCDRCEEIQSHSGEENT